MSCFQCKFFILFIFHVLLLIKKSKYCCFVSPNWCGNSLLPWQQRSHLRLSQEEQWRIFPSQINSFLSFMQQTYMQNKTNANNDPTYWSFETEREREKDGQSLIDKLYATGIFTCQWYIRLKFKLKSKTGSNFRKMTPGVHWDQISLAISPLTCHCSHEPKEKEKKNYLGRQDHSSGKGYWSQAAHIIYWEKQPSGKQSQTVWKCVAAAVNEARHKCGTVANFNRNVLNLIYKVRK